MYVLTEDGAKSALNIISEFCHGFNIDEIAANGELDANEIKILMMVLCAEAGLVEIPEEYL